MKNTNRLLILTIVFNFLILIEAGHGIAVLGLFELMGITETVQGNFKISLAGSYGDRLLSAAMIATVGQLTLLVAYFKKAPVTKFIVTYIGIFLLLFSFSILTIDLRAFTFNSISFWGGSAFLFFAISLLMKTVRNHRLSTN